MKRTSLWITCVLVLTMLAACLGLFGLQNEKWARPDNPVTLSNILFSLVVGAALIVAARGSDWIRIGLLLVGMVIGFAHVLYAIGVFDQ